LSDVEGKVTKIEKDPAAGGWRVRVAGESTQREHYVPPTRKLTVKRGDGVKMGDALSSGPKNPRDMLARTSMNAVQKYLTDEMWNAYKDEGPVRRRNVETFVRAMTNLSTVSDPGDHDTLLRGDKVSTSEVAAFNRSLPPGKRPVQHKPTLQGVDMLPIEMQTDWIARLQSRNLKSTVLDAASEGWKSMLHSSHPIPGMAYGKEFGKGTEEAPWLY
jgi:DNA-directed RNA polymerase subunit beta'